MKRLLTICAAMVVLMAVGTVQADYGVNYTAELKGDCIKFVDAMYFDGLALVGACLGEDGVVETDTFEVTVDGVVTEVEVTIKAGGGKNGKTTKTVLVGGGPTDVGTFSVEVTDLGGNTYEITVTSDESTDTAALSYVKFCFGDVTVTAPAEGPYPVERLSDYEEPTEPEEEDD